MQVSAARGASGGGFARCSRSRMDDEEPIVAIGLLTQGDLNLLGSGFRRAFRLEDGPCFEDLIAAIEEAEQALEQQAASKG